MLAAWVRHPSQTTQAARPPSPPADVLSFQTFASRVEPVFLKERPGHARCYGCHSDNNRSFHLEKLSPGPTNCTADQSQTNFKNILQHLISENPAATRFMIQPLAHAAH